MPAAPLRLPLLTEPALTAWGRRIGESVEPPIFLALRGPLGAGKSTLARAVGRGAGVAVAMPSPTFNLLLRYPVARGEVVHLDLYRLDDPEEVWELGWEELGSGPDGASPPELVMVEWPERAEGLLPPDRWDVTLSIPDGEPELREVEVRRVGDPPKMPLPESGAL